MPKAKQPSRKGKAAWRKNIDISGVEARLENERAAERAGMAPVNDQTASSSIFIEDRAGDEEVSKAQKNASRKPLKSLSILRQKDVGFAPVLGRARKADKRSTANEPSGGLTPEQRAKASGMSRKDMDKLRRIVGRDVRGAFGVVEEEARDGITMRRGPHAVSSESYDVWEMKNGERTYDDGASLFAPTNQKAKAPNTVLQVRSKDVSLPLPDQGQSYNPAAEAHEALLKAALKSAQTEEEATLIEAEFLKSWKSGQTQEASNASGTIEEKLQHLLGMTVFAKGDDLEGDESGEEHATSRDKSLFEKKIAKRKTKRQRAKAKRVREEIQAQQATKIDKKAAEQIGALRSLKKKLAHVEEDRLKRALQRKKAREQRLDAKVGMYKMPKRQTEVQLGEDLAESLRGLKPEGNLLRDRLDAFQRRGLVTPKHAATGRNRRSTRPTARTKEYETHSYKRFS